LQDKRHDLNDRLKTKAGQEPLIVVLLNDDSMPNKLFIVGDSLQIAEAADFVLALLLLFAVYYLMDLNYPQQFAQILGLIQQTCLKIKFPMSYRSAQFIHFKEVLMIAD
jgi:hypothetical protein